MVTVPVLVTISTWLLAGSVTKSRRSTVVGASPGVPNWEGIGAMMVAANNRRSSSLSVTNRAALAITSRRVVVRDMSLLLLVEVFRLTQTGQNQSRAIKYSLPLAYCNASFPANCLLLPA